MATCPSGSKRSQKCARVARCARHRRRPVVCRSPSCGLVCLCKSVCVPPPFHMCSASSPSRGSPHHAAPVFVGFFFRPFGRCAPVFVVFFWLRFGRCARKKGGRIKPRGGGPVEFSFPQGRSDTRCCCGALASMCSAPCVPERANAAPLGRRARGLWTCARACAWAASGQGGRTHNCARVLDVQHPLCAAARECSAPCAPRACVQDACVCANAAHPVRRARGCRTRACARIVTTAACMCRRA